MANITVNEVLAASLLTTQKPLTEKKGIELKKMQQEYEGELDLIKQLEAILGITDVPKQNDQPQLHTMRVFEDGYPAGAIWINKVAFVLENYGEMTTGEVVDFIRDKYEPILDRQTTVRSISAVISQNTGVGKRFKRRTNERNENVNFINVNMEEERRSVNFSLLGTLHSRIPLVVTADEIEEDPDVEKY